MNKKVAILILTLFMSMRGIVPAFGAEKARKYLLRDGSVLAGVDGKLTSTDNRWFLEFYSDLNADRGLAKAETSLELLPSATLEKIINNVKEHPKASYRLWGSVTKYQDKNFIFPRFFLPISEIKEPEPSIPQYPQQQKPKPTINEPNDPLAIPDEIIAKLKTRRIIRPAQLRKGLELEQDFILVDRTGFVARQADGKLLFTFGALGRNVQELSFRLLPCQVLERAQRKQSAELENIRFKVAGVVTKYKGEHYLLLQRAKRAYSHGNFPR